MASINHIPPLFSPSISSYIETCLVIPVSEDSAPQISNSLRHAHYPHGVDLRRGVMLVFNMPCGLAKSFAAKHGIDKWEYHTHPTPPKEYAALFSHIDSRIRANAIAYRRGEECGRLLHAAFGRDGYSSWRLRYYLCRGLYALIAESPTNHAEYEESDRRIVAAERALSPRLARVVERLRVGAEVELDFYFDTDRLYIGWFAADMSADKLMLSDITALMNRQICEIGLVRNTRRTDQIAACVKTLTGEEVIAPQREWQHRSLFLNHVIVPWQSSPEEIPAHCYVSNLHYVDEPRRQILVFNMSSAQLCSLAETRHPVSIYYSEGEPPLRYRGLFGKVEAQIRANLPGFDDERLRRYLESINSPGICNFYARVRALKGIGELLRQEGQADLRDFENGAM